MFGGQHQRCVDEPNELSVTFPAESACRTRRYEFSFGRHSVMAALRQQSRHADEGVNDAPPRDERIIIPSNCPLSIAPSRSISVRWHRPPNGWQTRG